MGRENWKRCVRGRGVTADSIYREGLGRNMQSIRIVRMKVDDDDNKK
jgi:hypothetical protein